MRSSFIAVLMLVLLPLTRVPSPGASDDQAFAPGTRTLLDAHNCYPDAGRWSDRIDRALSTGTPLAIEQDLVWSCPTPGSCTSVVSHSTTLTGDEPSLQAYFFERIRPIVERALAGGDREDWPLITLNLDFKTLEPEHIAAVAALLEHYDAWLTTAERREREDDVSPLRVGPVLVLTGDPDEQQAIFHDRLAPGDRIRAFGAVHVSQAVDAPGDQRRTVSTPPREVRPGPRTNYRRWWNNPWVVVEGGGQTAAGEWTDEDDARLGALVAQAHDAGLWIRFYTLNGAATADSNARGWTASYNFGSLERAKTRWSAAIDAGVDFVATDDYEGFASALRTHGDDSHADVRGFSGVGTTVRRSAFGSDAISGPPSMARAAIRPGRSSLHDPIPSR